LFLNQVYRIEPKRIVAIDVARPLVIISLKTHTPSKDAATPRTADDTMCVTGEVTLMERRDEIHIKKPRVPVSKEPHINVTKGELEPCCSPNKRCKTPGASPTSTMIGNNNTALPRFEYHPNKMALPSTPGTVRERLITTECTEVSSELRTPHQTPLIEIGVPSSKTPMKNPKVTTVHENRMEDEGFELRKTSEVRTVKGRSKPLATW